MSIQSRFSQQDLERIKSAVKQAESKISGEIVPVFVEQSGKYAIANYQAGIFLAGLAFVSIIFVDAYFPPYAIYDPFWIFIVVAVAGAAGGLLSRGIPSLRRIFLTRAQMDFATRRRAETAFLEEQVFNTRLRTGIMIFISFYEHEVIVMADVGIDREVKQDAWDGLVAGIIMSIRQGKLVEGIEAAIRRSGEILLEKGFLITPDDINELGDELRFDK